MTKIKLYGFTTLLVMCFSMLQAQNDTLINPVKITEYDKLMDTNYNDSIAAKYARIKKETDIKKKKNYSGQKSNRKFD